jgi:hypothetical protein
MLAPPSPYRSRKLHEICKAANLTDPYRILYPRKREFTYSPRTAAKNRSRLDFFLINDRLISILDKCFISTSLLTTLFDHKCVHLSLRSNVTRIILTALFLIILDSTQLFSVQWQKPTCSMRSRSNLQSILR